MKSNYARLNWELIERCGKQNHTDKPIKKKRFKNKKKSKNKTQKTILRKN